LSDSADAPLYVETLPRRGYRFIAPVEMADQAPPPDAPPLPAPAAPAVDRPRRGVLVSLLAAVALAATATSLWLACRRPAPPEDWQRITFRHGTLQAARFGPGGQIVYGAAWDGAAPSFFAAVPAAADARPLEIAGRDLLAVTAGGD